jgi:GNAT superfamily N-acetyltransferase
LSRLDRGTGAAFTWSDSVADIDWDELSALFEASPPMGNKQAGDLKTAFTNSMFRCFLFHGRKLVGAGRAMADGVYCAYVCDIAVLPDYRGIGLGKEIVAELLRLAAGHKKIILYAVPGAEPFYQKFGFQRMRTAMAIFENQGLAMERGYLDES